MNELLSFFDNQFNQVSQPFNLKKRKKTKKSSSQIIDILTVEEANGVYKFLQNYCNLVDNTSSSIQYGNTGIGHLIFLLLEHIFKDTSIIKDWNQSVFDLIFNLEKLRLTSKPDCCLFEIMISELYLLNHYDAMNYSPPKAKEYLENSRKYFTRILTNSNICNTITEGNPLFKAR